MDTNNNPADDTATPSLESTVIAGAPNPAPKYNLHLPDWLPNAVSMLTAVASLLLSIYTLVITTSQPQLLLIMPNQVRIAQGGNTGPLLYIQPMFISTGLSERAEVVTTLRIQVEPLAIGSNTVEFIWDEQGNWVTDPNTMLFNWVFTGDSGPFLVNAHNAQFSTGLFIGPHDWSFAPGRYRITLTADRITVPQPLIAEIEVVLAADEIEYISQAQGTEFLIFPVQE